MPSTARLAFVIPALAGTLALAGMTGLRAAPPAPVAPPAKAVEPPARWIWQNTAPVDNQKAFFRREFTLPQDVISASVAVTCDNWQRIWVNGHDLGWTSEWSAPANHDLTKIILPGTRNVVAVEGRNQDGVAALALRFSATLKDGRKTYIVSDDQWTSSLEAPRGWQEARFVPKGWSPAVVVGKMGDQPWGEIIAADAASPLLAFSDAEFQSLAAAHRDHPGTLVRRFRGLAGIDPGLLLKTCVAADSRRAVSVQTAEVEAMTRVFGRLHSAEPPHIF